MAGSEVIFRGWGMVEGKVIEVLINALVKACVIRECLGRSISPKRAAAIAKLASACRASARKDMGLCA
jgi:hypothetical protein